MDLDKTNTHTRSLAETPTKLSAQRAVTKSRHWAEAAAAAASVEASASVAAYDAASFLKQIMLYSTKGLGLFIACFAYIKQIEIIYEKSNIIYLNKSFIALENFFIIIIKLKKYIFYLIITQ